MTCILQFTSETYVKHETYRLITYHAATNIPTYLRQYPHTRYVRATFKRELWMEGKEKIVLHTLTTNLTDS